MEEMPSPRQPIQLALYLVLTRNGHVLLRRRANTGWQDGNYGLIAGHVDPGESAATAVVREAAGVRVDVDSLRLVHVMHRRDTINYVDLYITCDHWLERPRLMEPEKADDHRWARFDALPENLIAPVAQALRCTGHHTLYSEHGW